uniref:Uncharacterized protein n=1 Tax=Globodera rostochiensis TaxID=31243 RepID=A0A914GTL1_GLORO
MIPSLGVYAVGDGVGVTTLAAKWPTNSSELAALGPAETGAFETASRVTRGLFPEPVTPPPTGRRSRVCGVLPAFFYSTFGHFLSSWVRHWDFRPFDTGTFDHSTLGLSTIRHWDFRPFDTGTFDHSTLGLSPIRHSTIRHWDFRPFDTGTFAH